MSLQTTTVAEVGADWFYVHEVNLNHCFSVTATKVSLVLQHTTFGVHWSLSDVCLFYKLVITKDIKLLPVI